MLGLRPIGSAPLSTLLVWTAPLTIEHTEHFASQSFTTRGTDAPAHKYIPGRVKRGFTIGRRISHGQDGQFGSLIEASYGEIELDNTDGGLNSLVSNFFADGREVRVKTGFVAMFPDGSEAVNPYTTFETVYRAVAWDWLAEHDVVKLRLTDIHERLKNRLQSQVYAGTGGSDGTEDMAGMTRPTAFGLCKNITGQVVDPFLGTIQLHAGEISSVDEVYERGAVLTAAQATNYPTYAALVAASIQPGEYATCLADGYIRIGMIAATELSAVTADIKGHVDQVSGNYVSTHGSVLRMILRDYGGFTNSQLDQDSFIVLQAVQPASTTLFLQAGDQSTIQDVLATVAASCGAVVGEDGSGLYRAFRLEPPAETADWTITERNVVDIDIDRLPYRVPWRAWGIGYGRNWTVQTSGDLTTNPANPSQARRQFLQFPIRYAYAQDAVIAVAHLTSRGIVVDSLFSNAEDAAFEAQRRSELYSLGRLLYRVTVKGLLFNARIGETVNLRYPRWDLASGKRFVIVGLEDDADSENTVALLFG